MSTASCGERGGLCMVLHCWEGHDPSLVLLIPCSPPFSLVAASWNREGRWSTLSHGTSKYHLDTTVTLITASFSLKNVNLNRILNLNRKKGGEMPLLTVLRGLSTNFSVQNKRWACYRNAEASKGSIWCTDPKALLGFHVTTVAGNARW